MELSSQMILFARVAEQGSFSAAARDLSLTPSAVSKQISALEDSLGIRLLTRTQQGICLTEEGRVFYDRCHSVAAMVAETRDLFESMSDHPRGVLRVHCTVAFGKAQILPILPAYLETVPEVTVDLELTDRQVDIVSEEVDVSIRFSEQIDNSTLIARKLAPNRRVICAAPSYIERRGLPERPSDLAGHNCLRLSTVEKWNDWRFVEGGDPISVQVTGNFEANSADAVYHAALAGMGIARLSTYLVGDDIAEGRLLRLLPDYVQTGSSIYAIYPERRNLAPKLRSFLDYLTGHFGKVPPWERRAGL
ncbi:LysR family transcriptional regulator [Halovulum dunhuangense]|uniref:LysR family transcriptional regulator n=1 Tax=Halovulum dunhuangense TaxID=1505036 RepID=A0A849KQN8_9RHOB|nr:LysR family transcriptional regulator [Halovulum dunhuangense]NNU79179.1 LysR family transcriptional regulator [Halovulum dunhuangense]